MFSLRLTQTTILNNGTQQTKEQKMQRKPVKDREQKIAMKMS